MSTQCNIDKESQKEAIPVPPPDKSCPPIRNVTHPLRYYEFSQEEIKVLEECDRESFYKRCLPFSLLFSTATVAAIKCGFFGGRSRQFGAFGAVPKVALAILIGYYYGRWSYIPNCEKKLRNLSGQSYLGDVMRRYHEKTCIEQQPKEPELKPGEKKSDDKKPGDKKPDDKKPDVKK